MKDFFIMILINVSNDLKFLFLIVGYSYYDLVAFCQMDILLYTLLLKKN